MDDQTMSMITQEYDEVVNAIKCALRLFDNTIAGLHSTGTFVFHNADDLIWFEIIVLYQACDPENCAGHTLWATIDKTLRDFDQMSGSQTQPELQGFRMHDRLESVLDGSWKDG